MPVTQKRCGVTVTWTNSQYNAANLHHDGLSYEVDNSSQVC